MTKFEEEAIKESKKSKFIMNSYDGEFTASDIGLNIKLGRVAYNFPWLEFAKNWHSDEEFQELKEEYSNQAESILSMLDEIKSLKSQLQQQDLPVVPECVDKWYKFHMNGTFSAVITAYAFDGDDKAVIWLVQNGGMDLLCKMKLDGYTVEKPQLFYLKNKLTTSYLELDKTNDYFHHTMNPAPYYDMTRKSQFTQAEIDSMQTGSYEQIEVAE